MSEIKVVQANPQQNITLARDFVGPVFPQPKVKVTTPPTAIRGAPALKVVQPPTGTVTSVGQAQPTQEIRPANTPSPIFSMYKALTAGADPTAVLQEIYNQNKTSKPSLAQSIRTAVEAGADRSQILDEIFKQNGFKPLAERTQALTELGVAPKPGFVQSLAQGIAKTPIQVGKGLVGLIDAVGSKVTSDPERKSMLEQRAINTLTQPTDAGYFGTVQPSDYSIKSGLGAGLELGSYAIGGGGAKNVLGSAFKTGLIKTVAEGAGVGLTSGLTGGVGVGLQQEGDTMSNVIREGATGAVFGTLFGGVLAGLGKGLAAGISKTASAVSDTVKVNQLKNALFNTIDDGFNKGIRPSIQGKSSIAGQNLFKENTRKAVATILENKSGITFTDEAGQTVSRLPKTVDEFLQAISQTKKSIFAKYDYLQKFTGKQGGQLELQDVAQELRKIAANPKIRDVSPQAAEYALQKATALEARGKYSTEIAQDVIEGFNQKLKAFYRNPNPNDATSAYVDSFIANRLRGKMDDLIAGIADPNYQILKNQYGALASIEKDVAKKAIVQGRKATKGFFDLTDVFSTGDVVNGILSGNPALIAKGAAQKVISSVFKRLNDADVIVAKMFKSADGQYEGIKKAGQEILAKAQPRFNQALPSPSGVGAKVQNNVPQEMPASIRPLETGTRTRTETNFGRMLPSGEGKTPIDPNTIYQPSRVITNSAEQTLGNVKPTMIRQIKPTGVSEKKPVTQIFGGAGNAVKKEQKSVLGNFPNMRIKAREIATKVNNALNEATPGLYTNSRYTVTYTGEGGKQTVLENLSRGDAKGWLQYLEENGFRYAVKIAGTGAVGGAIKAGSGR